MAGADRKRVVSSTSSTLSFIHIVFWRVCVRCRLRSARLASCYFCKYAQTQKFTAPCQLCRSTFYPILCTCRYFETVLFLTATVHMLVQHAAYFETTRRKCISMLLKEATAEAQKSGRVADEGSGTQHRFNSHRTTAE